MKFENGTKPRISNLFNCSISIQDEFFGDARKIVD